MSTPTRSEKHPMAFTTREFWRGAWRAWGLFMALLPVVTVAWNIPFLFTGHVNFTVVMLMYVIPIGGVVSLAAMLVFSPIAWLLGRGLQRVAARGTHLIAFTLFGAVVGVVAFTVFTGVTRTPDNDWVMWLHVAASAAAVGFSWWRTADRALQADAGATEYRRGSRLFAFAPGEADAAVEDRALGG